MSPLSLHGQPDATLWTGGWDSTFRVLQRAMVEGIPVHPYYVVDRARVSSGRELDTMNGLLRVLEREHPEAYARIEPPRYVDRRAIPANAAIRQAWNELRVAYDIGNQYDWLPRFAEAADLTGVELSIYGGGRLRGMFGDHVVPVETPDGRSTFALGPDAPEALRLLFGRFAFPLWPMAKRDTLDFAARSGLTGLLDAHTWFCFNPKGGQPCGVCRPCRFMVKDGLGHRLPTRAHLRYAWMSATGYDGVSARLRKWLFK